MADKDLFGNESHGTPPSEEFELADGSLISESDLKEADEETQIDAMRRWFLSHFQNPVEETPYDSREGGYQYLHGGPYDAREEIDSRFEGVVPDEVRTASDSARPLKPATGGKPRSGKTI